MRIAIFVLALLGAAAPAAAQSSTTGAIAGKIVDKGGAALAGVTVVATSPVLSGTRSAISEATGSYTLSNLPPGIYMLKHYYGDSVVKRQNITVRRNKTTRVAVTIDTSNVGEMIVIRSEGPVIDATNTSRGITIGTDYLRKIPVPGRTFESALGAAAGSAGDSLGVSFSGSTSVENSYIAGDAGGTEDYRDHGTNPMTRTSDDRFSTFAIDVDTASYTIMRTKITDNVRPPPASVRVEEWVNYFRYHYAGPTARRPFAVHMDAAPSPFTPDRTLLRVGVQARRIAAADRKPANLVFLVDVSGSMSSDDKLGLAKRSLRVLLGNLDERDSVALVTYAGSTRVVLEPTSLRHESAIIAAIEELGAGGSTAMGAGIELAYGLASRDVKDGSVSRVIVLSDGDANVGTTGHDAILKAIEEQVERGVTLTTVGFGMGNYKDHKMEQLANKGNGNNFYIDNIREARKVFGHDLIGTLEVVAKDVKIQVEMNPRLVRGYRLIGYENRDIADEDFRDDEVDAGEIGGGHTVTAMYELDLLPAARGPLAVVRLRSMVPRGKRASEVAFTFNRQDVGSRFDDASSDFRFAAAVVGGAEILRKSPLAAAWRLADVVRIAEGASDAEDEDRAEFIELMRTAARLEPHPDPYVLRPRRPRPRRLADNASFVVAGAGVGGLLVKGASSSTVAPITTLRLGYGRGATDLSVHLGASRNTAEATVAQTSTPLGSSLSVYTLGAVVSRRFFRRAAIQPVGGLGLESLLVSPRQGPGQMALAAIARVGFEVAAPTSLGTLALGFDATGHLPMLRPDNMPMELDSMVTFGTYLDARF